MAKQNDKHGVDINSFGGIHRTKPAPPGEGRSLGGLSNVRPQQSGGTSNNGGSQGNGGDKKK